jgi:hypothetical protein
VDRLSSKNEEQISNQTFEKDIQKFGRSRNNGVKPTLKAKRE